MERQRGGEVAGRCVAGVMRAGSIACIGDLQVDEQWSVVASESGAELDVFDSHIGADEASVDGERGPSGHGGGPGSLVEGSGFCFAEAGGVEEALVDQAVGGAVEIAEDDDGDAGLEPELTDVLCVFLGCVESCLPELV